MMQLEPFLALLRFHQKRTLSINWALVKKNSGMIDEDFNKILRRITYLNRVSRPLEDLIDGYLTDPGATDASVDVNKF